MFLHAITFFFCLFCYFIVFVAIFKAIESIKYLPHLQFSFTHQSLQNILNKITYNEHTFRVLFRYRKLK